MLVCLSCPKQDAAHHQHHPSHKLPSNSRPQPVKSFTTQLKDIVLKFSTGAYRHCRPCTADHSSDAHDQRNDDDEEEERSSILKRAPSEASSDARSPPTDIHKFDESSPSRYDLLPLHRRRRHRSHRRRSERPYLRSHSSSKTASFTGTPSRFSNSNELKLDNSACPDRVSGQLQVESGQFFAHGGASPRESSEEWVAQVEPGVMITLVALPDGSNHLKRIRFSQELFDKWQAQLWWAENSDMVHELYSLTRNQAPCESPTSSCSTSSCHEAALRNTPEMLSRANSTLNSPCRSSDFNLSLSFPTTLSESTFNILSMNYDYPCPPVEAGCSTPDNPPRALSQCDDDGRPHSQFAFSEAVSPKLGLPLSTEPRAAVCDDDRPQTNFTSYAQFNDRQRARLASFAEFDDCPKAQLASFAQFNARITSSESGSSSRLPLSESTGRDCRVISEGGSSPAATEEAAGSAKRDDRPKAPFARGASPSQSADGVELFLSTESLQRDDHPPRSPSPAQWYEDRPALAV